MTGGRKFMKTTNITTAVQHPNDIYFCKAPLTSPTSEAAGQVRLRFLFIRREDRPDVPMHTWSLTAVGKL